MMFYHGVLQPYQCLYIPPSFFIVSTPMETGKEMPFGIRETFLPDAALAWQRDNLQSIKEITDVKAVKNAVNGFLDLIAVKLGSD